MQVLVMNASAAQDCVERHGESTCVKRYEPQQLVKGMYSQFVEVRVETV